MARNNPLSVFDQLDYQIIKALHQDARMSASKMARMLGEKERTVRKRIDKLIEMGVGRLTFVVERQAFGYGIAVDIFLNVEQEREEEILEKLLAMPEISYLAYGQGTCDLSVEGRFKTSEEMYEFLRKTLPALNGVEVKEFALVPRVICNIDQWLPPCTNFRSCDDE